jgi:monofunctional biosynthetic peptidoglycan transglycosylase
MAEGEMKERLEAAGETAPEGAARPTRRSFLRRHPYPTLAVLSLLAFSGYLIHLVTTLPDVRYLRKDRPGPTSLMQQRDKEAQAAKWKPRRAQIWVPLADISENLVQAVLLGEDANFFGHSGFDFYEIRESLEKNIERRRFARGASTITQQLAKNLFLSTEKTLTRKLKEALLTHRLERELSKRRILEIYLNVIEWGDGVYGAEAAARTYFGKSSSQVDVAEAALLAAMIPNPRRLTQDRLKRQLKVRQERILNWMWKTGRISEAEYREALAKPLEVQISELRS